ncbi:MAG: transketolase [Candidatus Omnitrophica bacterium CG08_land_8_20_14_0_20_41_16]|uniref:Transketolase n=1 Tax=Candidatus Sherwoodlollariibacterium unditelluris TaxID=1974757 RepID=A0A2G9YIP8_9BACT|nr:MAG: transketolase [Candidatus Omnitrophica bacterium CG23_combo_of_CG06-09_8_20_14_all_41_10]PIS33641.1 MAG: transketolase [Candidatus Omnitrophica bacterium CG08_land_8_20_14_0_20_41_16]
MAEFLYQRDIYGQTLVELGKQRKDIVVLDADLSSSTRTSLFAKEFPERFFNFGIAEGNMMAAAAGLAAFGKTVFLSTFAMFASGRAWDQVRNSIAYNNFNVKIVATHAGITVGPDGASHQALEDLALMRVIPNMNIIVPCDAPQTAEAVITAANTKGPFYIRLGRTKVSTLENKGKFEFGKAQALTEGNDIAIIACGIMVSEALIAVNALAKKGIKARLINMHTLKPIDTKAILKAAKETRGIIVCEEHSIIGGLASSVAEVVAENYPTKVARVGIKDRFGQSGEPAELLKEYNLTNLDIEKAAVQCLTN